MSVLWPNIAFYGVRECRQLELWSPTGIKKNSNFFLILLKTFLFDLETMVERHHLAYIKSMYTGTSVRAGGAEPNQ